MCVFSHLRHDLHAARGRRHPLWKREEAAEVEFPHPVALEEGEVGGASLQAEHRRCERPVSVKAPAPAPVGLASTI